MNVIHRTKHGQQRTQNKIMYDCLEQGVAFKVIEENILTLRPALTITK